MSVARTSHMTQEFLAILVSQDKVAGVLDWQAVHLPCASAGRVGMRGPACLHLCPAPSGAVQLC